MREGKALAHGKVNDPSAFALREENIKVSENMEIFRCECTGRVATIARGPVDTPSLAKRACNGDEAW